jgi:hypothetical protein
MLMTSDDDMVRDGDVTYWKPDDVPPDLTPIERSIIAARNVRAWADWLLETGPAPAKTDALTDIGPEDQS